MIEVNEGVRRPEFIAQFLSSNELSRPFQERRQYLKGLFLQFYLLSRWRSSPVWRLTSKVLKRMTRNEELANTDLHAVAV